MSDTPRTDEEYERLFEIYRNAERFHGPLCCPFENDMRLCRQLERELNVANEKAQRYYEAILKHKAENEHLTKKIHQLYEGAEEQRQTIKELQEVNEYLRQKNDKLEYGRTSK